jgi:hypothetical protein
VRSIEHARRHVKYAAISLGAGLLGVLVARSTWIGIPIAVVFFVLAAYLIGKALQSLPPAKTDPDDVPRGDTDGV